MAEMKEKNLKTCSSKKKFWKYPNYKNIKKLYPDFFFS